jgi:diguanylate cyclase
MVSVNLPKSEAAVSATDRAFLQTAARLQRAVLKLAFSFYGHSADLDERLKRLGNLIKAGRKDGAVHSLIEEVVELIVSRENGNAGLDQLGRQLGELLAKLNLEHEFADEARALQRRLAGTGTREELERHTNELVTLLNTLARRAFAPTGREDEPRDDLVLDALLAGLRLPPDPAQAVAGIRQRLRHRRNHPALMECARDLAHLLNDYLTLTPPQDGGTGSEPGAVGLARTQLQHLLERLVVPCSLERELARIRAMLDAAAGAADIEAAVLAIAELLLQAGGRSRKDIDELARFLVAVTRRIEEFKAQVARGGETHDESICSATDFQRIMSGHVADMRDRVDEETDLDNLKHIMMKQLESLETSVQTYVESEHARHTEARAQFDMMIARLGELENETLRLRQDLDEQHTLSLLDPLTSVFNRLGYNEGLAREYARWKRHGGELSLLVFDLDLFKSINDTYGHAAGDKVLASVAGLLRKQIRQTDLLCRLGGEEFAIILPETNLGGAAAIGEKLRASISASHFRFKEQPVPVTVSIGIAEFRGADEEDDVFERADRALYLAKKSGRNRCCTELELDGAALDGPAAGPPPIALAAGGN